MKVKNNTVFQVVGTVWSTWLPSGLNLTIEMSPDGKSEHFAVIGENIQGPDMFQCSGFNNNSYFRISGLGDSELDISL